MAINRRKWLAAGLGATAASSAQTAANLDGLRAIANAHGVTLTNDRLRLLQPVLDGKAAQLRALREIEIDDSVAPTNGIF